VYFHASTQLVCGEDARAVDSRELTSMEGYNDQLKEKQENKSSESKPADMLTLYH
jgi:hypothetical protein